MTPRYSGREICVLVPTKNRPDLVERLLISLSNQTEPVGRIVIVASGRDIKSTVDGFSDRLPIDYYLTEQPGQIRQRNIGISKVVDSTPLIACLDDDIELDPSAIKEVVRFWNQAPVSTGGVGLNIVTGKVPRFNLFQQLLFLGHRQPGRVLRSGISTSISHLEEDISSQWLSGGATVWRREVLVNHPHREIDTSWAIGEDLVFSYAVGKKYPLFVCAGARAAHNHPPAATTDRERHFLHGKTQTLWVYHFVSSNRELSKLLWFFTVSIRIAGKGLLGLITRREDRRHFARGAMAGIGAIARNALRGPARNDIREN